MHSKFRNLSHSLLVLMCAALAGSASAIFFGAPLTSKEPQRLSALALVTSQGAFCSGVLIGARTVVTAAHCVDDLKTSEFEVYFPAHNERVGAAHQRQATRSSKPQKMLLHPRWSGGNSWDLALVQIEGVPATLVGQFAPVKVLFERWTLRQKDEVWLGGFGVDEDLNHGLLKGGTMQVVADAGNPARPEFLVTATGPQGARMCFGDSGSGIYVYKEGYWFLAGIASAIRITDPVLQAQAERGDVPERVLCQIREDVATALNLVPDFLLQATAWDPEMVKWKQLNQNWSRPATITLPPSP